jgi:glyoxylase-like metal-dependent hydrolase (beta-lactamase superfamily II)
MDNAANDGDRVTAGDRFEAVREANRHDWERPATELVAPGVYRIPLPLNDVLRAVNVYLIEDGDGVVLIDAGPPFPQARVRLADALAGLSLELRDVRQALVTHLHEDHYTQAVTLRRDAGTQIALGRAEIPSLELISDPDRNNMACQYALLEQAGAADLLGRLAREHGPDRNPVWQWYAPPDTWLDEGTDIELTSRRLTLLHTPGHTHGHVVFHDPEAGLLFAGDHVLPHITPSIGFEAAVPPQPLRDYLDSLAKVRRGPDARLLPGHGPVAPSVHARVDELLAHHDTRLAAVAQAAAALGEATGYGLAGELRWTRRERRLTELDTLNQLLAVLETQTHARLLVIQGHLASRDSGGVTYYRPASPVPS